MRNSSGIPMPIHQQLHRKQTLGLAATFVIIFGIIFSGCQKELGDQSPEVTSHAAVASNGNVLAMYTSIPPLTLWELQQARAATAKYRQLDNALKDGYEDIAVDIQNMGHHFMKMSLVDETFNYRQPEILVYDDDRQLIAVEYAVPQAFARPEGFSGSMDVWTPPGTFPLWLLHAWVWKYNPDGVFNSTNTDVHLDTH